MKTETQDLIRFKTTQKMCMDYIPSIGSILLTIEGEKKGIEVPMHVIEIPKRQVFSIIRGLLSATQRFYRRKK